MTLLEEYINKLEVAVAEQQDVIEDMRDTLNTWMAEQQKLIDKLEKELMKNEV